MAEPSRKRMFGASTAKKLARADPPANDHDPLQFFTSHPRSPTIIDLREFATGEHPDGSRSNHHRWKGGFKGRPELIAEMAPAIKELYATKSAISCAKIPGALRELFRCLDECDKIPGLTTVKSVKDIAELHNAEIVRSGISSVNLATIVSIDERVRTLRGLPRLYWTTIPRTKGQPKDFVLDVEQTRQIYNVFKHRVRKILASWDENPDALPEKHEIKDIMHLCLIKSGWNEATLKNIDVDNFCIAHPVDSRVEIIHSIKERGGTVQYSHCIVGQTWSPSNLVRRLIRQTAPLRAKVEEELRNALELLDQSPTLHARKHIANCRAMLRIPWLYKSDTQTRYVVKGVGHPRHSLSTSLAMEGATFGRKFPNHLDGAIEEANEKLRPEKKISALQLTDLRDAYISFHYERHGYQWLIAQLAAGHSNVRSAMLYLAKRKLKSYGDSQIRKVGDALLSEIKHRKVVDTAVLFAMVSRGEITEEQRKRWEAGKDRTRMGTGCKDFTNPPHSIAPNHQPGTGCRVQRCVLCRHAVLFETSLDPLCRRKEELIATQSSMPYLAWLSSGFPIEMENLDSCLDLYDQAKVNERRKHWKEKIASGEHRLQTFEGEYGSE